jgi:hypothetical protein
MNDLYMALTGIILIMLIMVITGIDMNPPEEEITRVIKK